MCIRDRYYTPRALTQFMVDRIDPKPGEVLFDPSCGTGGFLTCAIRHMRERYVKKPEDEAKLQSGLRAVEKKPLPHMLCVTNMLLHGIEAVSYTHLDVYKRQIIFCVDTPHAAALRQALIVVVHVVAPSPNGGGLCEHCNGAGGGSIGPFVGSLR